jgi:hypothetical protein
MFDFSLPFFKPMWRRVVIVAFCLMWGLFEFANNAPFWAIIFLAMGGMAFWKLFIDKVNLAKLEDEENC